MITQDFSPLASFGNGAFWAIGFLFCGFVTTEFKLRRGKWIAAWRNRKSRKSNECHLS